MPAPSAAIVNAFVDPVVQIMQACLGLEARPVAMSMTSELDPPPAICVTIEATGEIRGAITWTFSEGLARDLAARLLARDAAEVDQETCAAAAAELANIAVGNATAALLDAGYRVEIHPPHVHPSDGSRALDERTLAVSVYTARGLLRVLVAIRETTRAG